MNFVFFYLLSADEERPVEETYAKPIEHVLSSKLDENKLEAPCSKKQKVQDWDDIDVDDMDDPLTAAEYAVEIFDYLKSLEVCMNF